MTRKAISPLCQCAYASIRQRLAARSAIPSTRRTFSSSTIIPSHEQPARRFSRTTRWASPSRQQLRWKGVTSQAQAHARGKTGPISVVSVGLFVATGIGLFFYFRYEKERMERKRIAEASKGIGKPKVGGPFELLDQNGQLWSSENMKGKYSLIYFGFSHCPDICPEELDKMAAMLDIVEQKLPASIPRNAELIPVFITCDPARDTPAVLKTYLKEFHDRLIGLTGDWAQIKTVCKLYRVYFSTPPDVKPGEDYLVDHSIYFYLMDPDGDFVEAIGRQHTAEEGAKLIIDHMKDWKGQIVKT